MGVPKLFAWLANNPVLKASVKKWLRRGTQVDGMAVDFNGFIYGAVAKVVKRHKYKDAIPEGFIASQEQKIFEHVFEEIKRVVREGNPSDFLIIAIDGVAPAAKINQQRKRRYVSSKERVKKDMAEMTVTMFDTTSISPGTDFMFRLDKFLGEQIDLAMTRPRSDENPFPPLTVYSPHLDRGEGEHIIAELLKMIPATGKTLLVHGADADLIMIYLARLKDGWKDIILMRETVDNRGQQRKSFVNLKTLGNILGKLYEGVTYPQGDFIAILFLNGNDFLPHFPSLERIPDALERLVFGYEKYIKETGSTGITTHTGLNMAEYSKFIKWFIANYQGELLKLWAMNDPVPNPNTRSRVTQLWYTELPSPFQNHLKRSLQTTGQFPADFMDQWYALALTGIYADYPNEHKFTKSITPDDKLQMVVKYIEGIVWVWNYYIGGEAAVNPRWYYPYHYAPLMSDIPAVIDFGLESQMWNIALDTKQKGITPLMQLPMIIPRTSIDVVPDFLHMLYGPRSTMVDMIPNEFKTDATGKMSEWQKVAILPFPHIPRVEKAIEAIAIPPEVLAKYAPQPHKVFIRN